MSSKIKLVAIVALSAITSDIAKAVTSGKDKLTISNVGPVLSLTPFGAEEFLASTIGKAFVVNSSGQVVRDLTDLGADTSGLCLQRAGEQEVEPLPFDLNKVLAGELVAYTRSGNSIHSIIDAGASAPTYGRVIFIQHHRDGYLLSGRTSLEGRNNGKDEHSQDLVCIDPKLAQSAPVEADAEPAAESVEVELGDENPLG